MKKSIIIFCSLLLISCSSHQALYDSISFRKMHSNQSWLKREDKVDIEGSLSLEDAVKLSLLWNQQLQATLKQKEIARGQEIETISYSLPHLTGRASYAHLDHLPSVKFKGQKLDNYSIDLQVTQPIFHGGAILARISQASMNYLLADQKIQRAIQQTIFETVSSYYKLLLLQELIEVNRQAVAAAQKHLQEGKAKFELGIANLYDVMRLEVDLSNRQAEWIRKKNEFNLSQAQLFKNMGISQKSHIQLKDTLSYLPKEVSLDESLNLALNQRYEVMMATIGVEIQNKSLSIAKSEYFPQINAIVTHKWGRPFPYEPTLNVWGREWTAGLSLEFPLFEGLKTYGKVKKEKALLEQRELELSDLKETVVLQVQQAIFSIQDAEELVRSQSKDLNRAKEALRLAEVGYKEGITSEVELTDALSAMTHSQALYFQALFQHNLAKLNYELATGKLTLENNLDKIEEKK